MQEFTRENAVNAANELSRRPGLRSQSICTALLAAGTSAIVYGIWRRDRFSWPAIAGGALFLYGGARQITREGISCEVSFTINRPVGEVYGYFRDLSHWRLFMRGTDNVHVTGADTVSWSSSAGEAQATITDERSDELLRWNSSIGNKAFETEALFQAAPGNRGCEVHCRVSLTSPTTVLGDIFAGLGGESLEQQTRESLRAMKQLLEAGEIPTTDGQPHGKRGFGGKASRAMMRESVDERRRPARAAEAAAQESRAVS